MSKWPQIQYLVLQYDDNIEYKFIGRSLIPKLKPFATELNLQNRTQI